MSHEKKLERFRRKIEAVQASNLSSLESKFVARRRKKQASKSILNSNCDLDQYNKIDIQGENTQSGAPLTGNHYIHINKN